LAFTLRASREEYSEREQRMFGLIPQSKEKPITSDVLVERFWEGQEAPYHARVTGMGILRALKHKMIHNQEKVEIITSKPSGPKPLKIWVQRKKN
jgi:hypothetical protein